MRPSASAYPELVEGKTPTILALLIDTDEQPK
jgi:hypothetical protein